MQYVHSFHMTSIHNPAKKVVSEDKRKENRKQKQREGGGEEEEEREIMKKKRIPSESELRGKSKTSVYLLIHRRPYPCPKMVVAFPNLEVRYQKFTCNINKPRKKL